MGKMDKTVLSSLVRLRLENTRVLFDFMQEISNRCTNLAETVSNDWKYEDERGDEVVGGYIGKGSLAGREKIRNKLIGKVEQCISECRRAHSRQNPLVSHLKFYEAVYGEDEEDKYEKIAGMLNYFDILRYLTEPEFKEKRNKQFHSMPYVFEDMCLSIKEMTGAKSCYLVYKREGETSQLISRSGYVVDGSARLVPIDEEEDDFSPLHIGAQQFDLLIKEFELASADKGGDGHSADTRRRVKLEVKDGDKIVQGLMKISSAQYDVSKEKQEEGKEDGKKEGQAEPLFRHKFLMFDFPYREGDGGFYENRGERDEGKDRRHFFVILELEKISGGAEPKYLADGQEETIRSAIRVLFLRNRLLEALREYYAGVLNFRFYCNYVQPVVEHKKDVRILHLTDLHLYDDDSWDTKSDNWICLSGQLKLGKEKAKTDLIAVTGDVAFASDDAASAQRKYKRVANLLFEIAKILWGEEIYGDGGEVKEIILPHDWKRRVFLTTGNHDYAAMNDVRVQTESRKITTGLPAKSSGGTMSKYTYYLEFLSYFLDAPTQKLLSSDLNEVRDYDKLGLVVGIFNTCSRANALQNNKVAFDSEKLDSVLKRGGWRQSGAKHVALAHHYPSYSINYFDDKYSPWKYSRMKTFYKVYKSYLYTVRKYVKSSVSLTTAEKDYFKNKFRDYKGEIKQKEAWYVTDSELYKDMEMLNDILNDDVKHPEEYLNKYLSEAANLIKTMRNDNCKFKEDWKKIGHKNLTVISGHTHKAQELFINKNNYYYTVVGHIFYDRGNSSAPIVYEIISLGNSDKVVRHVLCKGQEECDNQTVCGMKSKCSSITHLSDDNGDKDKIDRILKKW